MPWLRNSDDEVLVFHPAFFAAAQEALISLGLHTRYSWEHHLRTPGMQTIPDYVLIDNQNNRAWVLAIEIKRTSSAVFSSRFQGQAKEYAESNRDRYRPNTPRYFMLTNLENTLLFALNGELPAQCCLLQNGSFASGIFQPGTAAMHRQQFITHLCEIVQIITLPGTPIYDSVWPTIVENWNQFSNGLNVTNAMLIPPPATGAWNTVRDYFSNVTNNVDAARVFLLRALMIEYLRGMLLRHGHPLAGTIPALQADRYALANAIEALRQVDFANLFDDYSSALYRGLAAGSSENAHLRSYLNTILTGTPRMVESAQRRVDSVSLIDQLFVSLYSRQTADLYGKVQTDPELGLLLAWLTIEHGNARVIDPCCGDGMLLSAAFDRLSALGTAANNAFTQLGGIEIDPVLSRLSAIRLAIKEPAALTTISGPQIVYGDLFSNREYISQSDIILMNPPFKRYEAQDGRPIPQELRNHFSQAIQSIDRHSPTTLAGQPNLFNYYVEFVGKSARPGAVLGIILDNRWYDNQYGQALREFILRNFDILCIVGYPHCAFFENNTIATTIVVLRKRIEATVQHQVQFVTCSVDPRSANLDQLSQALYNSGEWPTDWSCRRVLQNDLTAEIGWAANFYTPATTSQLYDTWPTLGALFGQVRRGRLEVEEGGVSSLGFPFTNNPFKDRRGPAPTTGRSGMFVTSRVRALTAAEKTALTNSARTIPDDFRGYAIKNADDLNGYELNVESVSVCQTIEPPRLRGMPQLFQRNRSDWTAEHALAMTDMRNHPQVGQFIQSFEDIVNLTPPVLPIENIWVILREPFAGELIVPRKLRGGHRVHINPFAFANGRQVRISSNFLSYRNCNCGDPALGLSAETATRLIAAFLVSSFGQLQFEENGTNREGCCAIEKDGLNRIRVFDPRYVRPAQRQGILNAFAQLPYPIDSTCLSAGQPERNQLDRLWGEEMIARNPALNIDTILNSVHVRLDERLRMRHP